MSRTVSARISKEMHDKLRTHCNNIGCTIDEYIRASLEFTLTGKAEFDFGEEGKEDWPYETKTLDSHFGPCSTHDVRHTNSISS
jgi:predicted DNA-binding protein